MRTHLDRLPGPATVRVTLYPEDLSIASPSDVRGCRTLVSSGPVEFPFRPRSEFSVRTVEYERAAHGARAQLVDGHAVAVLSDGAAARRAAGRCVQHATQTPLAGMSEPFGVHGDIEIVRGLHI